MLRYDYQYDLISIFIDIALLILILTRTRYFSKATRIFTTLVFIVFFASLFDFISIFTISNPQNYSRAFNNFVSGMYLLCYNEASTIFFMYIDNKGKIPRLRKPALFVVIGTTIFYVISLATSPITHLVFYFDEAGVYCHGILMTVLYIIPFISFAFEIYIFITARARFSGYQIIISVSMVLSVLVAVVVQIVNERLLIGQVILSIMLFFVYELFENSAYFTYNDTRCLNVKAFIHTIHHKFKANQDIIIVVKLNEYNYLHNEIGVRDELRILNKLADIMQHEFGSKVYNISSDRYAIISSNDNTIMSIAKNKLNNIATSYIETDDVKFRFSFDTFTINVSDNIDERDLLLLVEFANENVNYKNIDTVLNNVTAKYNIQDRYLNLIKPSIRNNTIQVYYQPIYNVEEGRYTSAEALIRIVDEETGKFVNSEEFIKVAEQAGYIDEVGSIVFESVCKFIKQSKICDLGIEYIEVNISPMQCISKYLVDSLTSIVRHNGIKAEQLNLEITETAEIQEKQQITDNIIQLNKEGFSLSVDDYGSGFASADYLIKFPISIVKIDKSILWSAMRDENAMIVLKSTIAMIKALGKKIVVEGVETQEMADLLKSEGCEFNQGYLFSKPIDSEAFYKFIQQNNG